ncbi:unnamed protein product [Clonostachys rosea]|uniref:Secreted protein n=1 Tax=Bionectria ochroleuca TaxID=29856 RepID=A0ABY6U797_BIOOC|nr:unnamed protein product [Clonostachys rosea]
MILYTLLGQTVSLIRVLLLDAQVEMDQGAYIMHLCYRTTTDFTNDTIHAATIAKATITQRLLLMPMRLT